MKNRIILLKKFKRYNNYFKNRNIKKHTHTNKKLDNIF